MKLKQCIAFVLLFGVAFPVFGAVKNEIVEVLQNAGFENIKVLKEDSAVYVSYENSVYRWNVKGIAVVLDSIAAHTESESVLNVVLLNIGVPQVVISTKSSDWVQFRNENLTASEYEKKISVSYETGFFWNKLNSQPSANKPYWKPDLVLYPQLKLTNIYLDRMYDVQINLAPALEFSLWKGAKATMQWVFPIVNSERTYGVEDSYIHPGFVTLSQQFQLCNRLYTNVVVGLFNSKRAGVDWVTNYHLSQSVSLRAELASTGGTYMGEPKYWSFGRWQRITWSLGGSYFNEYFQVQLKGAVQKFIAGDTGARVDLVRMFGEVGVGFYGLVTEGEKDAGFNVAIPLPGSKRTRWKNQFRVMLPKYFDWEYGVSNKSVTGSFFETKPDENNVEHFFNPVYLKSQLLNF